MTWRAGPGALKRNRFRMGGEKIKMEQKKHTKISIGFLQREGKKAYSQGNIGNMQEKVVP